MSVFIPGTVLNYSKEVAENSFSVIAPLLSVTKGLTLAQVRELTGLETTTIQNWVKRGWVKNPHGKRYGEEQVMRIILINMMRSSLQLEQIAYLMSYVNGSVEDRADDILPDRELFNILCSIIYKCENQAVLDAGRVDSLIEEKVGTVEVSDETQRDKLKIALRAMVLAILSARMRDLAQQAYSRLG